MQDDGKGRLQAAKSATAATRDYVLDMDTDGAPLLNVFGGKITTYRKLAESAMARLDRYFPAATGDWTAEVPLPGGDFPVNGQESLAAEIETRYRFLDGPQTRRLVRTYGTDALRWLDGAKGPEDLGRDFGAGITARELDWTIDREWVRTAEDYLWRRTKLGLRLSAEKAAELEAYIRNRVDAPRQEQRHGST